MKSGLFAMAVGLLLAIGSSMGYYHLRSQKQTVPWNCEMGWLRHEFALNEEQWQEVLRLHADYLPHCRRLCDEISHARLRLEEAIAQGKGITPEVEMALAELARVKEECHRSMLAHAFRVAEVMDSPHRERYLEKITAELTVQNLASH